LRPTTPSNAPNPCAPPDTWPKAPTTSASRPRRTAEAQLLAARDGLKVAEAEKGQIEAQRRELLWRRGRTEVIAPADGVVSRRMARIGGFAAGSAEPMFRIVANGEVELDAEIPETRLSAVQVRQPARLEIAGVGAVMGRVRLVSPESTSSRDWVACASIWATTAPCAWAPSRAV
jgi:multidrug resistance efflux pump